MELNNIFHPRRLFLLLREELFFGRRNSLVFAGATGLLLVLIFIFNATSNDGWQDFHQTWFTILLYAGGFLFTSVAFSHFANKTSRQFHLALPASTLEKFTSKWLISAILYPIAIICIYQLYAWGLELFTDNYVGVKIDPFTPFNKEYSLLIRIYIVLQSIFLLGATVFHRYSIFKTLFSLAVIGLFLALFTFICMRLVFAEYWTGPFTPGPEGPMPSEAFIAWIEGPFTTTMLNVFWWVLAPVVLVIGFLKLKEKEV